VLHGTLPREELVDAIATSTRQYAKRQETWFRHQLGADVRTLDATRSPDHVAAAIVAAWEQTSR
jgi:tRNA dimethylallyltransferase